MAKNKKRSLKKRIYNPVTGKYYALRQRTTETGERGEIRGLWQAPKDRKKKSLFDIILGN
ncbi:MAG: hypothetical protein BME93_05130 [Methanosarcinales archaeon Met12]|nr:MAG: hypothetical protein BME93_05130 [Methanosarcinales archaeon Met12]